MAGLLSPHWDWVSTLALGLIVADIIRAVAAWILSMIAGNRQAPK